MGSTLEHGIYLPSEGEKNCYQGLASNWNKVDGALGDVAGLKQLIESKFTKEIVTELPTEDINPYCIYMILKTDPETNNIYDEWVYINNAWEYLGNTQVDMTQYYTKQEVNELPAVASGVTSTKVGNYDTHLADSNIHVTSADKSKWNTVALIKQLRLVNAQVGSATTIAFANIDDTNGIKVGDKCMDLDAKMFEITAVDTTNQTVTVGSALIDLALDANVVHDTGNEDVNGIKTFKDMIPIDGVYLGNESSTNERTTLCLRSNRDTANKSCAYISRFRSNKNQGELSDSDSSFISISFLENETRYTRCFDFGLTDWDADGVPQTYYLTSPTSKGALGTSSRKWRTINGIEPSFLSLPSSNTSDRIDISSYITAFDGTSNTYTPPGNGWISISANNSTEVYVFLNNLYGAKNSRPTAGSIIVTLPVLKDIVVAIRITDGSLGYARFIPCQGNI